MKILISSAASPLTMTARLVEASSSIPDDATLPTAVMASLRSMSVSDSEAKSPVSHIAVLDSSSRSASLPKPVASPSMMKQLKQLKAAKKAAKRARDAAPGDEIAQARYESAKKRYKEMKMRTTAPTSMNVAKYLLRPLSLVSSEEDPFLSLQQHKQHGQHMQLSQQVQQAQQHVLGGCSPRVAAAARASRLRRDSSEYLDRMSVGDSSYGYEIGSNGVSGHGVSNGASNGASNDVSNGVSKKSPVVKRVRFDLDESMPTRSPGDVRVGLSSVPGKSASSSGKVLNMSSEKATSSTSILGNTPIPERQRNTNSGKKTKYQQHIEYASDPQFHPEWRARREEWLSNYSNAGTIRKYRPYINKLIAYIQQQGNAHLHPGQSITRTLINNFQHHIKTNETPNNQTTILSAVSSFLKHLAEEDVTAKDRSKSIKIPAQPKPKKKKDLTIEQVKLILNAAEDNKTKALIAAAYFAGLRTKETVYLTANSFQVVDGNMTIKVAKQSAKGKKARDVPIAKSGADLLAPFIVAARARGGKQYLFPGRFKDTHIVERTMWNYIKKPARAVGLEEVASHHFRHAYASHAAQNHVDIATIKDQMGHSSLETTSKYVHGKRDHASSVSVSLEKAFTQDEPEAPPPVQKANGGATNELVQLVNMYKEGLLTRDEFNAAKKNLKILQ